MNIPAIGYGAYANYASSYMRGGALAMPSAVAAVNPVAQQPAAQQQAGTPFVGYMQDPAAVYKNADGDRAEISKDAKSMIPEVSDSGRLDSLKPEGECKTCAERKYMDGSDDPSVSYQSPTKISPNMAGAAVAAHEQEHVRNEQAKAQREGKQVVNQSVTMHYDTCPECGRTYVSGGTTRTTTVGKRENPMAVSGGEAKTPQSQPSAGTE